MCKRFTPIVMLVMLLVLPGAVPATASYIGTSPLLPPLDGVYLSPQAVHTTYSGGALTVILQDIQHGGFTNIIRDTLTSPGNTIETFDSTVTGNVTVNGGPITPVLLTGPVRVELFGYAPNNLGTFNTEMLQLDLSGLVSGNPVLIRESPTLASSGQTTIANIGGGLFRIDSFFDVFTELSVDGGQTWIPSQGPTHVDLTTPLPAALPLFASGLGALGLLGWRRKRKGAVATAA